MKPLVVQYFCKRNILWIQSILRFFGSEQRAYTTNDQHIYRTAIMCFILDPILKTFAAWNGFGHKKNFCSKLGLISCNRCYLVAREKVKGPSVCDLLLSSDFKKESRVPGDLMSLVANKLVVHFTLTLTVRNRSLPFEKERKVSRYIGRHRSTATFEQNK